MQGVLAEFITLDQDGVVHLPAHLSDEEAATLPCAAVTAWHALVTEGHLQAGDDVLIQGTGGVSLFALQFASALGAKVVATTSDDARGARLRALGAERVTALQGIEENVTFSLPRALSAPPPGAASDRF